MALNFSDLTFRQAKISEASSLTELCLRSKSYWKYSVDFLEKCRPFLTMTEEYIEKWPVVVALKKDQIIGYYSLKAMAGENRLDNLWVDLPFIGQGIGKHLLFKSLESAQVLNWKKIYLASEPGAVEFYLKFGGKVVGKIQSRLDPSLFLPHIEFLIK